jgi:hypothetical protein
MDHLPSGSANKKRASEGSQTLFAGVVSKVNETYFVLGTGGARFFFPRAPLIRLRVGDRVTVKAVRLGAKYVAEAVTRDSDQPA